MTPFDGPGLSRRVFARLGASGLVASWFLEPSRLLASARSSVPVRGTARNLVLVSLAGAPSHVDTFDFKEGPWTPPAFQPETYGGVRFPRGLMPRLAARLDTVTLVRSCRAWALVHGLAQTWNQISRNPASALGSVAPHLGSVIALELAAREPGMSNLLPPFLALGFGPLSGAGYLPSGFGPFVLQPQAGGIPFLAPDGGRKRFRRRVDDIGFLDAALRAGAEVPDLVAFQEQARALIESGDANEIFSFSQSDLAPFGATPFGASCLVAHKVLAAKRGARCVQLTLDGWDHHTGIYEPPGLSTSCSQLDAGLSTLLDRLGSTAGELPGKTLLEETLVLVSGEFGRTTGPLNGQGGRDHFLRYTALLAGGGLAPGRVLGRTDAAGDALLEAGWSAGRDVRPEDLAATVYSALGIDWTTVRTDDPFGRGFEYVPYAAEGVYRPVEELWAQ